MQMQAILAAVGLLMVTIPAGAQERTRRLSYGLELGWAHEQEMFGSGPSSGVQMLISHAQVIPTLLYRPGRTFERIEWISELSVIQSIHPSSRLIMGVSQVVRLDFHVGAHWTLFTDTGAGIAASGLHHPAVPELQGWMQYELQQGVGIKHGMVGTHRAVLLKYCLTHFSNDGTTVHNLGLNMHTIILGVNF